MLVDWINLIMFYEGLKHEASRNAVYSSLMLVNIPSPPPLQIQITPCSPVISACFPLIWATDLDTYTKNCQNYNSALLISIFVDRNWKYRNTEHSSPNLIYFECLCAYNFDL
jgi:hypothetical protein